MIQLLNVAEIVKKPSGLVFIYDTEGRLLQTPRAVKEIRRFYTNGLEWTIVFTFDDQQRNDVSFEVNYITLLQYAPAKFQTYTALGATYSSADYQARFESVYAYLADYIFIGCCDTDPDTPSPFPYPSATYAEWLVTLNADLLPKGLWIEVTDIPSQPSAIFSLFCTETNEIALGGFGQFLNADWQNVGDYTGVFALTGVAFTANIGQWYVGLEATAVDGDVVIYNCLHYQVIDAAAFAGTAPDVTPAAYTLLPKATANMGYIKEVDEIEFEFVSDWLQYRADKRGNTYLFTLLDDAFFGFTYTAIDLFQWGRDTWYSNQVVNSVISQINFCGNVWSNYLTSQSSIYDNYTEDALTSGIYQNSILSQSSINSNTIGNSSNILRNTLSSNSKIQNNTIGDNAVIGDNQIINRITFSDNTINNVFTFDSNIISNNILFQNKTISADIARNTISLSETASETISTDIKDTTHQSGNSTQKRTINITGLTTIDLSVTELVGIYNLTSANAAETVNLITNYPTLFPFTLKPAAGLILTVTFTAVASVAANGEIISSTAFLALNGDNDDEITLNATKSGAFDVIEVVGAINNA